MKRGVVLSLVLVILLISVSILVSAQSSTLAPLHTWAWTADPISTSLEPSIYSARNVPSHGFGGTFTCLNNKALIPNGLTYQYRESGPRKKGLLGDPRRANLLDSIGGAGSFEWATSHFIDGPFPTFTRIDDSTAILGGLYPIRGTDGLGFSFSFWCIDKDNDSDGYFNDDCDNNDPFVNPGVTFDQCDQIDNDCDGKIDEGTIIGNGTGAGHKGDACKDLENDESACIKLFGPKAWGDLYNTTVGTENYICCGAGINDEGVVLNTNEGVSLNYSDFGVCNRKDNDLLDTTEWVSAKQNIGKILHITNEDEYDIVGAEEGKWYSCDNDNSLTPLNGLQFLQNCEGGKQKCLSLNRAFGDFNEFLCFNDERIYECITGNSLYGASRPVDKDEAFGEQRKSQGRFITYLTLDYGNAFPPLGDDEPNDIWNNLYTRKYEFINPTDEEFTLKLESKLNWQNFYYLELEFYLKDINAINDLSIWFSDGGESDNKRLSNYVVFKRGGKNGVGYHVRIPTISMNPNLNFSNMQTIKFDYKASGTSPEILNVWYSPEIYFSGGDNFYCDEEVVSGRLYTKWKKDLDDSSTANKSPSQISCNRAFGLDSWTGNNCCGDDVASIFGLNGLQGEFYTDTEGLCFNSNVLKDEVGYELGYIIDTETNESSARLLAKEDGSLKILGCDLSGGLGYALNSPLIVDNKSVCDIEVNNAYPDGAVCTSQGWETKGYNNILPKERTSFTQFLNGSTSCCGNNDCYDGDSCRSQGEIIDYQSQNYVCSQGNWEVTQIRFDWFKSEQGNCAAGHCLLDSDAVTALTTDQTPSQCKPNNWVSKVTSMSGVEKPGDYKNNDIGDLFCDNERWSFKSKYIAELLINTTEDDYILVCGETDDVLIKEAFYNDQVLPSTSQFQNVFSNQTFNQLCILSFGNPDDTNVVIGSSFNSLQRRGSEENLSPYLEMAFDLEIEQAELDACYSNDVYDYCTYTIRFGSEYFYYNSITESFIYSQDSGDVLVKTIPAKLYEFFIKPLLRGYRGFKPVISDVFDSIYIQVRNGKEVIGSIVPVYNSTKNSINEEFIIYYNNYDIPVCDSVESFKSPAAKSNLNLNCVRAGDNYTISGLAYSTDVLYNNDAVGKEFMTDALYGVRVK